jgi:tyrosyl-tRNA synthetase
MKNSFLDEIQSRGYFSQCTNLEELKKISNQKSISAYIGFDCTANSLHIGSLMQIMILRILQKHGHRPIILMGGGTTLIGDPSGKDSTRKILDKKNIEKNIKGIKKVFKKLLNFNNKKTKPVFVNNFSWLGKLNYIEFLRDIGSHFTINKMLSFESVKLRLEREQSLSYMEFNYMILQAYDFYQLFKKENCLLQIGGSDQWGNIVNGVELIRRILKKESFGLTTPLVTTSSGTKMGKTEKGAIWLDENLLSSYDYWQFWRNTDDNDVIKFINYFTDLDIEEINYKKNNEKNINNLKILLANEATKLLHGIKAAKESEKTAEETFKRGGVGTKLPEIKIEKKILEKGISFLDILSTNNIISSKSEARRSIKNNGLKINDELIKDDKKIVNLNDFKNNNFIKISFGKKKHYLLKII